MSRIEKLFTGILLVLTANLVFLTYLVAYQPENAEATTNLTNAVASSVTKITETLQQPEVNDEVVEVDNIEQTSLQSARACFMDVVDGEGYKQVGMMLQGDMVAPTGRTSGTWVQVQLIDTNINQDRNCWYQP